MSEPAALLAQLAGLSQPPSPDPAAAALRLARASLDALMLRLGQSIEARVVGQLAGGLTQLAAGNESFVLKLETPLPLGTAVTIKVAQTPQGPPAVTLSVAPSPPPAQPLPIPAPPTLPLPQNPQPTPPQAAPPPSLPAVAAAPTPPAPSTSTQPQPVPLTASVATQPEPSPTPTVPQPTPASPQPLPQAPVATAPTPTVALAPQATQPTAAPTQPPVTPALQPVPAPVQTATAPATPVAPATEQSPHPSMPAATKPVAPAPQRAPASHPAIATAPTAQPQPPTSPYRPSLPRPTSSDAPPARTTPPPLNLGDPVQVVARQDSAAPLLAKLASVVTITAPSLPRPVIEVALKLLTSRIELNRGAPDGNTLAAAVLKSGVLADPATSPQPADTKATLLALRSVLGALSDNDSAAPAPPIHHAAPPIKGEPPRAPAPHTAMPDPAADPEETARTLLGHTDAALSRLKLLQSASQPADTRIDAPAAPRAEYRVEIPVLLGAETGILQLQVERDGKRKREPERERGWRMRFAMNFSATGEVGADIALLGRAASIAIWAADPDIADGLDAMLPELAPAIQRHGLELTSLRVRRGAPRPARPAPGQVLDSAR